MKKYLIFDPIKNLPKIKKSNEKHSVGWVIKEILFGIILFPTAISLSLLLILIGWGCAILLIWLTIIYVGAMI